MKKYIAKFVPVEGEIKDGDFLMCTNGVVVRLNAPYAGGAVPITTDSFNHIKDPRKVKLFLGSRDIQKGDEGVHTPNGIGKCIVRKPSARFKTDAVVVISFGDGIDDTEAYLLTGFDGYKVVGEISPHALVYVMDGQEFEEDDVQPYVFGRKNHEDYTKKYSYNSIRRWPESHPEHYGLGYKIKGPCGHFH